MWCVNTDHLLQGLQVSTAMETSCQSLSISITNTVIAETVRETKVTTIQDVLRFVKASIKPYHMHTESKQNKQRGD